MTVIAWDGKTLAADKLASCGGIGITTTKIFRIEPSVLVGLAGSGPVCRELLQWARKGFHRKDWPASAAGTGAELLVVRHGRVSVYGERPYPLEVEDTHVSIGAGRDCAMAVMYLGHTAHRAVEVANALLADCGNGVDSLELYS